MEVVAITGQCQCGLVHRPDPRSVGEMVVVKVLTAPMCTEYKIYSAGHLTDRLGHEAAGEVVEIAQPGRVKVGDRVVVMPQYPCGRCPLCLSGDYIHCTLGENPLTATGNSAGMATYAQYLIKPDWLLVPVPNDLSLEHASMACCGLGPTFGAMQRMEVNALDTVLITGMGPVGLGGVINGVFRGAQVIAVESQSYRAALAKELGAAVVIDPREENALEQIRASTEGLGPNVAIDCSGAAEAQRLLLDSIRRRGKVAFVGESGELNVHISNDLIRKGLTLYGQWHYNLAETPGILHMIRQVKASLDRLITHSFSLNQVQEAFELQRTGNCGKIILKP